MLAQDEQIEEWYTSNAASEMNAVMLLEMIHFALTVEPTFRSLCFLVKEKIPFEKMTKKAIRREV